MTDMGVVYHHYISPYSFVMGVIWFKAFILLGLAMRKTKYPIKFSVVPLLLLLVLSVLRMFVAIEIPGATVILSERIYPAIVSFFRIELIPHRIFGMPINIARVFICIWGVGTIGLTAWYAIDYISKFRPIMKWLGSYPRDKHAETLLSSIIGDDKKFRVYRNGSFISPISTAVKPYIILPKIEFTDDELRVVLLHEWKHIRDKDYLSDIIINLICFLFWWNPAVYVWRRNFLFVTELKCDRFAVSNKKELKHFLKGLQLLDDLEKETQHNRMNYSGAKALVTDSDELGDRIDMLFLRGQSRKKKIITNVCYSIVIFAVFFASYTFTILPAFWEAADVPMSVEGFEWEHSECGDVFRIEENFLLDNGDGTFSLYIDGQRVAQVCSSDEIIDLLPIRQINDN
jgi:beta-lactamase regulating signal transducer with metallopeptidase domain